ncbi:glycoside hydrolase family 32 protein [Salinicoccus bachuensis]|uniref:Sucrose-6-phosphate hydrolase n=1 Tax=Salinicoccus bachuensis TaxID=3136731 RepID=A0ABZ3CG92_9STAP
MFEDNDYRMRLEEAVQQNRRQIGRDSYRLEYHMMPPVGFLNDPNGLVQYDGTYHAFFQWNPFETTHGKKAWGHYTSEDLVSWKMAPVALMPDEWYDKNGCYSGSAVEHEGMLYLFYTGNVKDEENRRSSYQCLAVSEDGMAFKKHGPVLHVPKGYTPDFRDPKVWRENGDWLMIIGAQNEAGQGEAVLARSENLVDWTFIGPIAGSGRNGLGDFGYMWECPDLFRLDGQDVLIVCPQGLEAEGDKYHNLFQAGYFIGDFDPSQYTYDHGDFTELDRGFDFYAPQTFIDDDGRRILLAWMGMSDDQEQNQPTVENDWIHALTIPRVLGIEGDTLTQNPVPEIERLRGERRHHDILLGAGEAFREEIGSCTEISMDFESPVEGQFEMVIRNDLKVTYENNRMVVERTVFSGKGTEQRAFFLEQLSGMRIFLDRSSVEMFINGGKEVCTCRFFPNEDDTGVELKTHAEVKCDMTLWNIKKDTIDMY